MEDSIKALTPVICPNCNHTMVVEIAMQANLLDPEVAEKMMKDMENNDEGESEGESDVKVEEA